MTNNSSSFYDLDQSQVDILFEEAVLVLGKKWFESQLNKDKMNREAASQKNHDRQRVRYYPKHPIVQWYVEHSARRTNSSSASEQEICQSSLLLANFASNLIKVRNASGLKNILPRLRIAEEFYAAAFEVEVACSYVNVGWLVEFIETGSGKSPDLKVTKSDGVTFWVECKCRDGMTGRDAQISGFWESLQDSLYRIWTPKKMNFGILLTAESDPAHSELQAIVDAVVKSSDQLAEHADRRQLIIEGRSHDGKYTFRLVYLADPDEQVQNSVEDLGTEWFSMDCEVMVQSDGRLLARNPKFFGYSSKHPPDKYAGVLNAFSSAVRQLPESGPGVVCIRIPCPSKEQYVQAELQSMLTKLQQELSGTHNTRVNCILVSTRFFSDEPNSGQIALAYRCASATIEHKNPKYKI